MIGKTISHYRITEQIGEGAMGVVYRADDTLLRRTVALKFLREQELRKEEERARFLREAQAGARLDHPNICTVYGIEQVGDRIFIVMAFVDGQSLDKRIAAGPLEIGEILEIGIGCAAGLQEAHSKGIVHRDVKSANILLTNKGQPKITDFGLAQIAGRSRLTRTGTTLGTVAYMSPEQALGQKVDGRTDNWSLAVVLYETATGRRPFEGEMSQEIVYSLLNEEEESVTALRPDLPPGLNRIIRKGLAKERENRFQHADDLHADLKRLRKRLGLISLVGPPPAQLGLKAGAS